MTKNVKRKVFHENFLENSNDNAENDSYQNENENENGKDKPNKSPSIYDEDNQKDFPQPANLQQTKQTFFGFLIYLILSPLTLCNRFINWIKKDPRLFVLTLTSICCLGFALDVVRQHMHPEKYINNQTNTFT